MRRQSERATATRLAIFIVLGALFTSRLPAAAQQCVGDCNGDGSVTIDELITGVNIVLEILPLSACPAVQCNPPAPPTVDCLTQAVNNGLFGCPAPPILRGASKSSSVAVSDDETVVLMANPEAGTVSIFSTDTAGSAAGLGAAKRQELPTGEEPVAIVIHPDNDTAFVANRGAATVTRVEGLHAGTAAATIALDVGSEPTALALSPTGKLLFVSEWAEGRVSVVDTESMTILGTVVARNPRAVAVTNDGDADDEDETLIVAEFYGAPNPDISGCPSDNSEVCDTGRLGRVLRFPLSDFEPEAPLIFRPLDSGFAPSTSPPNAPTVMTAPNQLYSAAIQGGKVYVTSVSASPQPPINFQTNVFPVLYVGDLSSGMEDLSNVGTANIARLAFDQVAERPRFLQEIVDLDFDGDSNVAYVVSRAADIVQRLTYDPVDGIIIGTDDVKQINVAPNCQNPIGIAVAADSRRAYVNCWITRRLGVIDLEAQELTQLVQSSPLPAPGSLEEEVSLGRRFYFTGRGRWSNNGDGYSSCGSCHPDALSDNITWSFAAGPRQTTSMDGSFSHGPGPQQQRIFNWTGIFDEIHDFERNTRSVSGGLGAITISETDMCGNLAQEEQVPLPGDGLGLPVKVVQDTTPGICTTDWDKIDAFVRTLRPPRALRDLDPDLVAQGAALFAGRAACTTCHGGPAFTAAHRFWTPSLINNDMLMITPFEPPTDDPFWSLNPFQISGEVLMSEAMPVAPNEVTCGLRNVGSFGIPGDQPGTEALEKRASGTVAQGAGGFNIPALYGLSVGAPYFHHGQAATLDDLVFDPKWDSHLRAGNPNLGQLTNLERAALVSYLLSIDAHAPEPALIPGRQGCPEEFPTFVASLDGAQEVDPPVTTEASGRAIFQLNADKTELTYEVIISDLTPDQILQAHLHVGPRGFNGPVVFFLADAPPPTMVLRGSLDAADLIPRPDVSVDDFADFIAALEAGDVYVNVHTMAHPAGEIRGQVQAPIRILASLSGDQEVPVEPTTATGSAEFRLSADRQTLSYSLDVQGIAPDQILQAHLHVAPRGFNGPVVLFLAAGPPSALPLRGTLTAADLIPQPDVSVIDFDDFVDALLAGDVYANVHTQTEPAGEIRGQLSAPEGFPARLSGAQEVDPPVVTDASGKARMMLSADQSEIRFAVAVSNLPAESILQAHIHVAPRGFNGGVVFFLADSGFAGLRMGRLTAANLIPIPEAGIETFADFLAALRAGDTYVNVHTIAHPAGEIRGQIDAPTVFLAGLDGGQEVPPVTTAASGRSRIVLNAEGTALRFALAVNDLPADDILQAHIHVGPPDMNGPVALFLAESSFNGLRVGTLTAADYLSPPGFPTYADFLGALRVQNTYANVHTVAHMDGEIRGRILAPLTFDALLSGAQEVPPVESMASGTGRVVISTDRQAFRFALAVKNLPADQILQAHIHVGPIDMNGAVAFFLADMGFVGPVIGTRTPADFIMSPEVPTYADFVGALLGGGTYMNVHTLTHMDGEIRRQLE